MGMSNAFCCRFVGLDAHLTIERCSKCIVRLCRSSRLGERVCVLMLPGCACRMWSRVAADVHLDCSSTPLGFLFSLSGHLGEANSRRAVTGVPGLLPRQSLAAATYAALPLHADGAESGPAAAPAVDMASYSRGARRAEPAAPAARVPSRLSGRGSSIQDAYGSSRLGRGRGGRSGATRGEDAIRSGDSWSIPPPAARPRKAIAKPQLSTSRQPRSRKDAGGAHAVAFFQPVSPSPSPQPLPPVADQVQQVASRLGHGIPGLGAGDDHDDGGSVRSRRRLDGRTRPANPRPQERQRDVEPGGAPEPGGAGDPRLTAVVGPVPGAMLGQVPAADPGSVATIERLLQRVNAKELHLRARWSHLSAFLGAASDFRSLVADCEQYVGLLTARADRLRAHVGGGRRVQAHATVGTQGQREADESVTVGKRHWV